MDFSSAPADADVTASAFSAWGPTPSLEIKPEIAGPGGMIFSLASGEKVYTVMSGTSMSSPFVAGVAALVKQRIHESGFQVENEAEWIRHILMNTANPVVDELHGLPVFRAAAGRRAGECPCSFGKYCDRNVQW